MAAENTTVLFVDKPAATDALKGLVEKEYRVLTAADAASAVKAMEETEVHILLTEQHLPVGTGVDLLTQARDRFPGAVRMLFVRDEADMKGISLPLQQGLIYRHLMKPCRPSDLKNALRHAAELSRLKAERKTLQAQLAKAAKLKLQFLALLGGELRTPITYIDGLVGLMKLDPDAKELSARVGQLSDRTRRLGQTIENILTLLEAEKLAGLMKREALSVADLATTAVEGLKPYLAARRQELEFAPPPAGSVPSVTGFQPMLLDALSTLLLNAIIVSPDGAKLRMALSSPGPTEVAVEVSDAGEMVPEIERPHVFEPFYFSRNPKTKSPGPETATGLNPGLATVKRYIALHGGTVELKDTGPGGSTFLVRLPAAGTAALSSGTAHSAMPSTPSGTGPAVVIPPAG